MVGWQTTWPRIRRPAAWLAAAGIALLVQGCDDAGETDDLTLLGEGGCRVADGGEGSSSTVTVASWEECAAQCPAGSNRCTALEYNSNNGACEIHTEPITRFEPVDGVRCYVAK